MALVIFGMGGHGTDMAEDLWPVDVVFYDDHHPDAVGGLDAWVQDLRPHLVGINDPDERRRIGNMHPGPAAERGVWIHQGAQVGPGCSFGRHTHVNAGVTITRTAVGDFCTISPGATICGDVTIGHGVTIGANATVCQFSTVGNFAVIGAGAVLPPHTEVGPGETWVGNPAKCIGRREVAS